MSLPYAFAERLEWSHGKAREASIETILLEQIPGATRIERACTDDDRNGTDYWVHRTNGRDLSIDAKVRAQDWSWRGADDLALEVWSVVERGVAGWTTNSEKRTDYILWLWRDTGRWCLVPFPMLCGVAQERMTDWCTQYKTATQFTPDRNYHSMCVFVPRREVWRALYARYAGSSGQRAVADERR